MLMKFRLVGAVVKVHRAPWALSNAVINYNKWYMKGVQFEAVFTLPMFKTTFVVTKQRVL
jgi:hypothetical protein